jgi:hypothetical protein
MKGIAGKPGDSLHHCGGDTTGDRGGAEPGSYR